MSTIPASDIVNVIPGVVSAGGSALDLIGLLLTTTARTPIGSVVSFGSAAAVSSYFGASAPEVTAATIYFNGFDNSDAKPAALLIAQYPSTAVASFLRGGSLAAMTLPQLQALTGTLALTVNGVVKTSSTINLSGATSFSNAATIIVAAFTTPGFTVTFDSVSSGFLFTNSTTGASSTLTFATATGTLGQLLLGSTGGGALSQGAAIAVPATFMDALALVTTNWASFFTMFDPDAGSGNTLKLALAAWTNGKNNRYAYVCWDTDVTATTTNPATGSLGYILTLANSTGTIPVWAPDYQKAAFISGSIASIDFSRTNGRATMAFRSQTGLTADVSTKPIADNLLANGYNFYGIYATANDTFVFLYKGSVTGPFLWVDSYINQIWLNNALQLSLMSLLTANKSVPYNPQGYSMIQAALSDPISQGLNFGAFRVGVALSAAQAMQVNVAAGLEIDRVLSAQGWYLQILAPTAAVRAARGSPTITFWYVDGGSVQKISLSSIEVQ